MELAKKLFENLAAQDNYPMTDNDMSINYFFKGCKVKRFFDGKITVYDVSDREGHYRIMNDEQIDKFLKKHFDNE